MKTNNIPLKIVTTVFFVTCMILSSRAQVKVNGTIVSIDDKGPLAGINVRIEGIAGVVETSDENGKFSIEVPSEHSTLTISYPGFKNMSFYLDGQTDINIKMIPEKMRSNLDFIELPVGERQKRFIAQSYDQLDGNNLHETSFSSVDRLISGNVAGLNAVTYNGAPGAGASLHIRGINSAYAGTQPLFIVDGVEINLLNPGVASYGTLNSPLLGINPEDIENIVVLKDASAKGYYGARGANGVVIINTYKGEKGSSKIDFTMSFGKEQVPFSPAIQNADENRQYLMDLAHSQYGDSALVRGIFNEYLFNDTSSILYQKYNNNTNWPDLIKKDGFYQNYHFRMRGGDDVSKYSFSIGFKDQKGVVINNDMQRLTARFNLDYNISKKIRVGNRLNFTRIAQNNQMQANSLYNPFLISYLKTPLNAPYLQDNEGLNTPVYEDYDFFGSNPLALANSIKNDLLNTSLGGALFGELSINDSWLLYANANLDRMVQQERVFVPAWGVVPDEDMKRIALRTVEGGNVLDAKIESRFNKKMNEFHHISSITGTEFISRPYRKKFSRSYNASSDDFINLDQGAILDTFINGQENSRMISAYEYFDYVYKDKYLLNVTVRVDGSSRFGLSNPFVTLPVFGAGWRLGNESFLRDKPWLDELKIRASFGYTANENIGNSTSRLLYGPANYKNLGGISYYQIANEGLRPEIVKETGFGIDMSLFNQHVNLAIDVYDRLNTNMLVYGNTPLEVGYNNFVNEGKLSNKGIEWEIEVVSGQGAFTWGLGANLCYNINEVISLPQSVKFNYLGFESMMIEGQPLGVYYGYQTDGVFATSEEAGAYTNGDGYTYSPFQAGDIKFKDLNNDFIIDENDKTFIGKPSPDLFGGFYGNMGYKGFAIDILFDMQMGREVINGFNYKTGSMNAYTNQASNIEDRWKQEGDITDIPRVSYDDPTGNNRFSDRWVEDGSFVRLKNVKLSYELNNNVVRKLSLQKIRLFVSAENLMTFTNYSGFSPDVNHLNDALFSGVDYFSLPVTRSYNAGVIIGL